MTPYVGTYAKPYAELYNEHPFWTPKMRMNRRILRQYMPTRPSDAWIDLFCGQAPFFDEGGDDLRRVGVDRSESQLAVARSRWPKAELHCADASTISPDELGRFELVSLFWGAYAYLRDLEELRSLVRRIADLTDPCGTVVLEIIDPSRLHAFNSTPFAREHDCEVTVLDATTGRWRYRDCGGIHEMLSPPLEFFRTELAANGLRPLVAGEAQTMFQLVARRARSGA